MATQVIFPKLGMSMTTGLLASWLAPDGREVAVGQPLFLLETEKVSTEVVAEVAGRLHVLVAEGAELAPGTLVGWLLHADEAVPSHGEPAADVSTLVAGSAVHHVPGDGLMSAGTGERIRATPIARRLARERGVTLSTLVGSGPRGRIQERDVIEAAVATADPGPAPSEVSTNSVTASPVARVLADRLGLAIDDVLPGPDGTVHRSDVLNAARRVITRAGTPTLPARSADRGASSDESRPISPMRAAIGSRMRGSLAESAQVTVGRSVDVDRCMHLLANLQSAWPAAGRPTMTTFVVAAFGRALRRHPEARSRIEEGPSGPRLRVSDRVDVGVAVAVPAGLLVPVLRGADSLSLKAIAAAMVELSAAARAGTLGSADMSGATATVSNLGGAGVEWFTPILNPPESVILGVGTVLESVAWVDGRAQPRRALPLSLTFDHRVLDGHPAALVLQTVSELLADPFELVE